MMWFNNKKQNIESIPIHINGEQVGECVRFAVKEIDGDEYIELLGVLKIHTSDEIMKNIISHGITLGKWKKQ